MCESYRSLFFLSDYKLLRSLIYLGIPYRFFRTVDELLHQHREIRRKATVSSQQQTTASPTRGLPHKPWAPWIGRDSAQKMRSETWKAMVVWGWEQDKHVLLKGSFLPWQKLSGENQNMCRRSKQVPLWPSHALLKNQRHETTGWWFKCFSVLSSFPSMNMF